MAHLSSLPVRRLYVRTGAFMILGLSLGLDAALDLWVGESGILLWIVVFSGFLTVVGAAYEALTGDPDEHKINGYWLALIIFGALLTLTGFGIQLTGLAG
ncbi:hypothetical protein [Halococcus sp. AFM35]|uniref:hypothetical protein n=1 Tax=Halococcus sp. AFM35 TaxID=3421653 RepID=UPI003EB954DB